jgi:hypothetical protein
LAYLPFSKALDNPDSWFPHESTTFDFRTAGHSYLYSSLNPPPHVAVRYWKTAPMTLVGSLAVLVIGGVLAFVRFEAKVAAVFAAVLATLFAGLFWQEAVLGWVAAARVGLAAVIALWLVVFLLRVRHAIPFRVAAAAGAGTALLGAVSSSAAPPIDIQTPPQAESTATQRSEPLDQPPTPQDGASQADEKGGSNEVQ